MISDDVQSDIDRAQDLRRQGRQQLGLDERHAAAQRFHAALEAINAGFEKLGREEPPDAAEPTEADRDTARLFADLYGIRGGIYRDMIPLDPLHRQRAIGAYDAGARYEREFALKSTYNFVNQLVLRFLDQPGLLVDPDLPLTLVANYGGEVTDSVSGWLRRADDQVTGSLSRRADRAWALADLVLLAALASSAELDPRLVRFEQQVERDSDRAPYKSLLIVVRDLVRATGARAPTTLRHLESWLAEHVSQS